jgi:hypothetical protein
MVLKRCPNVNPRQNPSVQNPAAVRVVKVSPEDIPSSLDTPLEQLGEVEIRDLGVFPQKSKQHIIEKTGILLKRLASAEIQVKAVENSAAMPS